MGLAYELLGIIVIQNVGWQRFSFHHFRAIALIPSGYKTVPTHQTKSARIKPSPRQLALKHVLYQPLGTSTGVQDRSMQRQQPLFPLLQPVTPIHGRLSQTQGKDIRLNKNQDRPIFGLALLLAIYLSSKDLVDEKTDIVRVLPDQY